MATPDQARYAIGADMGSTNVRAALVCNDGKILKLIREPGVPYDASRFEQRVAQLAGLIRAVLESPEAAAVPVEAIGVGSAGQVDSQGNVIGHNGPREIEVFMPLRSRLQELVQTQLPVFADNDSKAAAWGEFRFGAATGTRHMICLTVGTGIGGGVVVDGKLLHGANGLAGHLGFVSVDMHGPLSKSGVPGCVEDYASGTAIGIIAQQALRGGAHSKILDLAGGSIDAVTSNQVFDAEAVGDPMAKEILGQAAYALGISIVSLVHTFNPDVVVLGGGVCDRGEVFLAPVRETVRKYVMHRFQDTPVKAAMLGNQAGVVGAAALCGF